MNFPIQHQLQHIILVDVFHSRSCSAPFSLFCFEHKWTFPSSAAAVAVGIALLLHPAHSSHSIRSPPIEIWRSIFNIMRWLLAFMLSTYMEYLMILYILSDIMLQLQHHHHARTNTITNSQQRSFLDLNLKLCMILIYDLIKIIFSLFFSFSSLLKSSGLSAIPRTSTQILNQSFNLIYFHSSSLEIFTEEFRCRWTGTELDEPCFSRRRNRLQPSQSSPQSGPCWSRCIRYFNYVADKSSFYISLRCSLRKGETVSHRTMMLILVSERWCILEVHTEHAIFCQRITSENILNH